VDDPVRIFRALRFECHGWRLSPGAEALIRGEAWDERLRHVPVERFSGELLKALAAVDPGRFFRRMVEFGVGTPFLPELFRMPHVPAGPPVYHPEGDLLTHALEALERMAGLTPDATARFCAFFHDVGKLATAPDLYPRHHGHDREGSAMAQALCTRLRLPAAMRKALSWSCRLHLVAARWPELRDSTKIRVAEEARKAGIAAILPLVVRADRNREEAMAGWEVALRVMAMSTAELGIDPQLLADAGEEGGARRSLPPAERPAFIRAQRVREFRRLLRA
jgi:tRNA nucleotidyltransferase (CCA-adding enzyme)